MRIPDNHSNWLLHERLDTTHLIRHLSVTVQVYIYLLFENDFRNKNMTIYGRIEIRLQSGSERLTCAGVGMLLKCKSCKSCNSFSWKQNIFWIEK
jgi:hypothetical protein